MFQNLTSVVLYCEILLICIIILVYFMFRIFPYYKDTEKPSTHYLKFAFGFTVAFISCDVLWILTEFFLPSFVLLNFVINILYYAFSVVAMTYYMVYCEIEMNTALIASKIGKVFIFTPITITMVMLISTYWTKAFFYINEFGEYTHGKYYFILPLVIFSYLLFAAVHAIVHSRKITNVFLKTRDTYLAVFMIPVIVLGFLEAILGYPFTCIGVTASFIGLFVVLQKLSDQQKEIIVDSLSEDFIEIIYVDLKSCFFEYIRTDSTLENRNNYFQSSDFFLTLSDAINHVISDEDRALAINALAKDKILYELRNHSSYYVDLRTVVNDKPVFYQIKFVRSKKHSNPDNEITGFIMAIRKLNDISQQDSLHTNAMNAIRNAESNSQKALYSDTLGSYEVNLSRNEIISPIYENVNGRRMDVSDRIPLTSPIRYTDFVRYYRDHFVRTNLDDFDRLLDINYLIRRFRNGYSMVDVICKVDSPFGQKKSAKIIFLLSQDEITGDVTAYVITKDVTSEENRNEEIKKNNNIIQILSNEYTSVYYVDLDTENITPYNREDEQSTNNTGIYRKGIRYSDSFQIYVENMVSKDDRDRILSYASVENIRKELLTKNTCSVIYKITKDGTNIYYQMKIVKVPSDDGIIHSVVMAFSDKNEEVMKEQEYKNTLKEAKNKAESASNAKSTFLFNMSHDIRTPMNAILGFTEMAIKHKDEPNRVLDYLTKVKSSGEHLLQLINDVLDMSRIESGKTTITTAPMKLSSLADEIIDMIEPSAESKNITFTSALNIAHDDVLADKLHLSEIIINVLSNAIKYTPEAGNVSFRIDESGKTRDGKLSYIFEISDSGIGMSREFLSKIYEPFDRENNSTVSGIQGTGLGMTITKSLIDLMGGIIAIDSEPGKGTTVRFQLDFESSEASTPTFFSENVVEGNDYNQVDLTGKRILVVDDNSLNREIAISILEENGMIVSEADDGDVAVDLIEESSSCDFDCILMDIQMARMNGYLASELIRHIADEQKSSIPIIAMTANAFDEDKQKAKECGMNAHLTKPINAVDTIQTIQRILK